MNWRRWLCWGVRGIGVLFVFLVLAIAGGYLWLRTSLPPVDGALAIAGLDDVVTIMRDAAGIPHVVAKNRHDAVFALGFLHAQDRIFQMDTLRRYGAGELAEIGGKGLVARDRFMRTLGIAHAAELQWQHLDGEVKQILQAYADGVNAYLAQHSGARFPLYYIVPGPKTWRPVDSLIIRNLMALYLSQNYRQEIEHAEILKRLAPDQMRVLYPSYPKDGLITLAQLKRLYKSLPLEQLAAAIPSGTAWARASNDWVIGGKNSVTGRPILENDPHLSYTTPSIWYLARLDFPGYQLTGGTIPGEPFLVVGHNGHVGWGFTETGGDVEDLFVEKLDPTDPNRYLTPTGSASFLERHEIIHVKGGEDVEMTVRSTRHGPVISDLAKSGSSLGRSSFGREPDLRSIRDVVPTGPYVLALQATFLSPDDLTAQAMWRMNKAQNWQDFRAALRDFTAPQMNVVFADTAGTIAFIAPARIPIRKNGHGWLPHPGWTGDYDWTGFIPFEKLPQRENPPDGRFISANNKIVPESYRYFIGDDWDRPYRADRIAALLEQHDKQSVTSTEAIAADALSMLAKEVLPAMLTVDPQGPTSKQAVAILRRWDYRMDRNQAAPLIFEAWLRELNRWLLADRLGPAFKSYWGPHADVVQEILSRHQNWCVLARPEKTDSCQQVLAGSLRDALASLAGKLGKDPSSWHWGDLHIAHFWSPVLSQIPLLGNLIAPSIAADGANETINAGVMKFADAKQPFLDTAGPSLRMVLDFSNLAHSRFLLAPGISENPFSSHYRDLVQGWRNFAWMDLAERSPQHTLTLRPR